MWRSGTVKKMRLLQMFVLTVKLMTVNCAVYKEVGDQVLLMPNYPNPITSITWTHGPNIAMEWTGGQQDSFQQFKDRGELNNITGALTIKGLTLGDSGNYTAEINYKSADTFLLRVIYPVPKPSVSMECDPGMPYCVFTCEGNTTHADPVTYKWIIGDEVRPSDKVINITKEDGEQLGNTFHCGLENPVSSSYSETLQNPFTTRERKWLLTCLVPLVVVILIVCSLVCKPKKGTDDNGAL